MNEEDHLIMDNWNKIEVLHKKAEPYKITLTRGQKGSYGWEIQVSAPNHIIALEMLRDADMHLRQEYGGGDKDVP